MVVLTREALLARDDLPTRDVEIGDGESVRIRCLSAGEVADWLEKRGKGDDETTGIRSMALLVAMSLANEDGSRMFPPDEAREIAAARLSLEMVKKVFEAAADLNGITKGAAEAIRGN